MKSNPSGQRLLSARAVTGTTGVPTTHTGGFTIQRTSAGNYQIVPDDPYARILGITVSALAGATFAMPVGFQAPNIVQVATYNFAGGNVDQNWSFIMVLSG